jgi:lipoate-protein ligase B
MTAEAKLLDLGRRPYREVWDLQRALHARVAAGEETNTWIFVEHEPVVTLGRNTKITELKLSPEALAERGIDCIKIERGGDATYHGPGQLVVYPILLLERFREVVPLVRKLEGVAIDVCAQFGLHAERWSEHAGVWVEDRQVCAIGLAVQKMASLHGIALNVHTTLDYDQIITPCGLPDRGITSLSKETQRDITLDEARAAMRMAIERAFDIELRDEPYC